MKNQNTQNPELKKAVEMAQFKFALIAPVVQGLFTDASIAEYCRRVTEKPLTLPDGRTMVYKPKTVEKWMNPFSFFGLSRNPFSKGGTPVKDCFHSHDFDEMYGALESVKDSRGVAVFTSTPGNGKTFVLHSK